MQNQPKKCNSLRTSKNKARVMVGPPGFEPGTSTGIQCNIESWRCLLVRAAAKGGQTPY